MDYFTDVLAMFLDLDRVRILAVYEGQRALRFHQKYHNVCSEDERRSYVFETTQGWVINHIIFSFGWTIPLKFQEAIYYTPTVQNVWMCS